MQRRVVLLHAREDVRGAFRVCRLPRVHGQAPGVGGVGHHGFVVALTEMPAAHGPRGVDGKWRQRERAHRAPHREGEREGWSASGEPHGVCTRDATARYE